MTVRSIGWGWQRRLVDRYRWTMFCRVSKITLEGPRYTGELLPHLANLSELRELALIDTSIPSGDLAAWQRRHPHVAVTATQRVLTR